MRVVLINILVPQLGPPKQKFLALPLTVSLFFCLFSLSSSHQTHCPNQLPPPWHYQINNTITTASRSTKKPATNRKKKKTSRKNPKNKNHRATFHTNPSQLTHEPRTPPPTLPHRPIPTATS